MPEKKSQRPLASTPAKAAHEHWHEESHRGLHGRTAQNESMEEKVNCRRRKVKDILSSTCRK